MRIRSHLDPTLFVTFLHVDASQYDEDFRRLARSFKRAKGTNLKPLYDALRERETRIFDHERYHFCQGLRLPFLHIYALLTLRHVFDGLECLAGVAKDWREWPNIGAGVTGFGRLDHSFHMGANRSGQIAIGPTAFSDYDFTLKFSPKEMLECAASIFDYQMSCNRVHEPSDPDLFRRWCKRNPAYTRLFDFLKDYLACDRIALRSILPLLNAAFHTSVPERGFAELASRVWHASRGPNAYGAAFLAQSEPCRWHEVFQEDLARIKYDYPFGETPNTLDLEDGNFYYLDPERWLGAQFRAGIQHPFLGPLATEWQKRAKDVAGLDSYLDMPRYVDNKEARQFAQSAEPSLQILRIFMDDGSDQTFAIGSGLTKAAFGDKAVGEDTGRAAVDILAAYGAFRRAFNLPMTEAARTCHLSDCPHFENNLCNCYPMIPDRFEDCGFPIRMQNWVEMLRSVHRG